MRPFGNGSFSFSERMTALVMVLILASKSLSTPRVGSDFRSHGKGTGKISLLTQGTATGSNPKENPLDEPPWRMSWEMIVVFVRHGGRGRRAHKAMEAFISCIHVVQQSPVIAIRIRIEDS